MAPPNTTGTPAHNTRIDRTVLAEAQAHTTRGAVGQIAGATPRGCPVMRRRQYCPCANVAGKGPQLVPRGDERTGTEATPQIRAPLAKCLQTQPMRQPLRQMADVRPGREVQPSALLPLLQWHRRADSPSGWRRCSSGQNASRPIVNRRVPHQGSTRGAVDPKIVAKQGH